MMKYFKKFTHAVTGLSSFDRGVAGWLAGSGKSISVFVTMTGRESREGGGL